MSRIFFLLGFVRDVVFPDLIFGFFVGRRVGFVGVDDVDHVDAAWREHFLELFVELERGEVPRNREVVEGVAEDEVVFLGVLVQIDELAGVAPVGLDGGIARQPGRHEVGAGDVGVDLGHVDLGAGVGELHVPLEAIGAAAQEQRLHG